MKRLLNILRVLLSFVSIVPLCSLGTLLSSSEDDYLQFHNYVRGFVSSPPLMWDPKLRRHAEIFLDKHKMDCAGTKPLITSGIGWNVARNWGNAIYGGLDAVLDWMDQIDYYDHVTNKCVGGECRSYTQLVWKNSTHLGCARIRCFNDIGTLIRCNYDPPGNIPGQRPY